MIPDDGEGATHLITIDVEGCRDREEAAPSPGPWPTARWSRPPSPAADPNWGRIVSAAGYAGVPFEEHELSLWLNDVPLYRDGSPARLRRGGRLGRLRAERETHIRLLLTQGRPSIRFWTCDLTAEYVRLNADYTT